MNNISLQPLKSSLLSEVKHGFFTRKGGVSQGIYEGLNCGYGSNDDPNNITENRRKVADYFESNMSQNCGIHQIHSNTVVTVNSAETHDNVIKADALVTSQVGVVLTILTADCQPILLHDPTANVIGAIHAGWRGAVGGIIENTIHKMLDLGSKRETIRAAIGPAISQQNYEVSQEFFEEIMDHDSSFHRFFINGIEPSKYLFNLPSFGLNALSSKGITQCEWISRCTYAEPDLFYSFRRSTHNFEPDYGRLISAIAL